MIQRVGKEVVDAQLHQDLPFEKLVEELKVTQDTSRHPIFQIMFAVQSFGNDAYQSSKVQAEKQGEQNTSLIHLLEPYAATVGSYNIAKFDMSTFIDDGQPQLRGGFNFAVSLYEESTIRQYLETYIEILKQIAQLADDQQKLEKTCITDLKYLNPEQYKQIVQVWNDTDRKYPREKTIQALFEEQVKKTPDQTALVYDGSHVTYHELNERANQLAHYLTESY